VIIKLELSRVNHCARHKYVYVSINKFSDIKTRLRRKRFFRVLALRLINFFFAACLALRWNHPITRINLDFVVKLIDMAKIWPPIIDQVNNAIGCLNISFFSLFYLSFELSAAVETVARVYH
jgi:hypothetical protein